jgi:hypothetical protein
LATLLVFVDACEDSITADDVVMPLNPLVTLIKKEEFEKTSLDVNVSQWSCEEELSRRMVHTKSIIQHGIVNCLLTHMP